MSSTGAKKDWSVERRWTRYKVDIRLKVTLAGSAASSGRNFTFGQGSDVSEGGMAAYIPSELNVGDVVGIEFVLPYSKEAITLRAEVRNRNGFRYGLEYVLISEAHQQLLRKSLQTLALMH
jgi:c-di-GMP-binding flagellar brake protein YcgR